MVMSSPFAGQVMMTFLAPAAMCLLASSPVLKMPRGLDHDVDAQLAPRQVLGIALGEHLDGLAVGHEAVFGDLDGLEGAAMDGIVLQQVRHRGDVAQVIDGDDLKLRVLRHRAVHQASDAAEPVDAYLRCHRLLLSEGSCCPPVAAWQRAARAYVVIVPREGAGNRHIGGRKKERANESRKRARAGRDGRQPWISPAICSIRRTRW